METETEVKPEVRNIKMEIKTRETEQPVEKRLSDIMKEETEESKTEFFSPSVNPVKYDDEYDVPAFIRKKMNKNKGEE